MGQIITKAYRPIDLSGFDLLAYSQEWQKILIEVGLLKGTSTGNDVLIVEKPVEVDASSAYAMVATIGWSANNGDFTYQSRTRDLAKRKPIVGQMARDRIVPTFFPELVGVQMGFNVWLQRYAAAFCVAPA